ncbi:MAG TPA: hypothetical protein VK097_11930 [Lentibacillus sp.]|uniref:hypothetical protein n=1 Tax=Lentibacillus sp. TaxID=1925746 RepID=UPI002B4B7B75|nr:hypothetical protein [Lentibacillus sp.]HLR63130.1 hypothetical protein [Lentibacillus sp.]
MTKTMKTSSKLKKNRTQDFTDALSDMTDQLRLLDQKITMAADNSIQEDFQKRQQELYHATYTINKLEQKQRISRKKLVPDRFTPEKLEKRLS